MPESAGGKAAAHNATIATTNIADLEDAFDAARLREWEEAPKRAIESAQAAVKKAKAQLAGAQEALKQAEADAKAEYARRESGVRRLSRREVLARQAEEGSN